jgi:hypothetical protein
MKKKSKLPRRDKVFFVSRKEALAQAKRLNTNCFKYKRGKNRYFVGSQLEWFSL